MFIITICSLPLTLAMPASSSLLLSFFYFVLLFSWLSFASGTIFRITVLAVRLPSPRQRYFCHSPFEMIGKVHIESEKYNKNNKNNKKNGYNR